MDIVERLTHAALSLKELGPVAEFDSRLMQSGASTITTLRQQLAAAEAEIASLKPTTRTPTDDDRAAMAEYASHPDFEKFLAMYCDMKDALAAAEAREPAQAGTPT